jgi:hypothetical protein
LLEGSAGGIESTLAIIFLASLLKYTRGDPSASPNPETWLAKSRTVTFLDNGAV